VRFVGADLYPATGDAVYGSIAIRDSWISGVPAMYLWYPGDSFIERNVLEDVAISTGTADGTVYVRNNAFVGTSTVDNWAAYGNPVILEKNTFSNPAAIVARLLQGYTSSSIDARGNYWGGIPDANVASMIFDRSDDLDCAGNIPFLPTLSSPDPATPTP
jgi:hypothetical protein